MRALYPRAAVRKALAAESSPAPGERKPFSLDWLATYLPHYGFGKAAADFHAELVAELGSLAARRNSKRAVVAPREGAKSTVITLGYVLYCAVEAAEPFTLILSDSADQAAEQLGHVRAELEGNERLAADYPAATGPGPKWQQRHVQLNNGAVIQAIGTGGRIRGRRAKQARPSLVVFDDVENNDSITSPAKRAKAWRWATREVIPAGSAGTNYLSVGSALHRDCVALQLGRLAGWTGSTYRAVHRWPERMDLWAEWERLATNWSDPDRAATAAAFYAARRPAMDAGAEVYWPERWPLHRLMERRAEIGAAAFDTEYQGVPSVEGLTEFPPEWFDDRPGLPLWFDNWPHAEDTVYVAQSLDPSKGRTDRPSDFQAHVQGTYTRRGTLYVEGHMHREPAPRMVARSLDLARTRPGLRTLAVEDNEGLGLVQPEFERQAAERGMRVPLCAVHNLVSKASRIRWLATYLSRGQIRFRRTRGTQILVDQLRDWPGGDHDDGPDALEILVSAVEKAFDAAVKR